MQFLPNSEWMIDRGLANSSLDPVGAKSAIFPCVMKAVRTILALLIALSVAVLPVARGVAAVAKSTDMTHMMTMGDGDAVAMDDMDCCPHQANPGDKMDKSACMAICALACFTLGGTAVSTVVFPSHQARLGPALNTNPLGSQTGRPPFRPPRV